MSNANMSDDRTSSSSPTKSGDGDDFSPIQQVICSIIPPLSEDDHKGQSGRIGVIGGCREYTGAPYFAAISALKIGADLSYVFCTKDAAPVIKSYSPELIVYPALDSPNALEEISSFLPKLHAVVIGPGLGRNERILANVGGLIDRIKELQIPMILDADALYFVSTCPEIIRGYTRAILTPNAAEFDRLYAAVYRSEASPSENPSVALKHLCQTLGHITIVRKGREDIISDGHTVATCNEPGSLRRCGGQGDILSGAMGIFSYWTSKAFGARNIDDLSLVLDISKYGPNIVAAMGACMLTRRCNKLAFSRLGRSTTTTDMIKEIRNSFSSLFPVD